MNKQNDGGPAFPVGHPEMTIDGQGVLETQGMTLRDWFAGQALRVAWALHPDHDVVQNIDRMAKDAYTIADAMLAAREANDD